jgi:methionine synthase II (cobalamin-independent)
LDLVSVRKEILIDDAGWGDLILGVVIGALKRPAQRYIPISYMERRIPVSSFQPPNFENKRYLDDAEKIAEEIVKVMQPDMETHFKVCSGYVLSRIQRHLQDKGFNVEEVEITGKLQEMVERSYVRWCIEVGGASRKTGRRETFLYTSRMGC